MKFLVLQFNPVESVAIKQSQIRFESAQDETDLQAIHMNYILVANAIQKLHNIFSIHYILVIGITILA